MFSIWKDVKQKYSMSSFITFILGIILIVRPDLSGALMCYMLGGALILMGLFQLIIYYRGQRAGFYSKFNMMMGIVLVLLGIWICAKPNIILGLIPVVLGFVLLLHAFQDLSYTIDIKNAGVERWWVALVATLITFVLGIFLVMHPFLAFEIAMIYVGIGLVYNGVSDLVLIILAGYYRRKADKRVRDFAGSLDMDESDKL